MYCPVKILQFFTSLESLVLLKYFNMCFTLMYCPLKYFSFLLHLNVLSCYCNIYFVSYLFESPNVAV
jgi:hypothetical protein